MRLSIVIPVFNEEPNLAPLLRRQERALEGIDWETVFVDDGSSDESAAVLRAAARRNRRVKLIQFSRNFGHQAAITAGLDFAEGDAVAVMDADLQDPPELLPKMLEAIRAGADVVSPQRISRAGESWFKRGTAGLFYRMLAWLLGGRLQPEVGDFRMFSRRAVVAMRSFREQSRFIRGLVSWLGLKETVVPFERPPRAAGVTKYPLRKMLRLAWTAVTSFSAFPLRLATGLGALLSGAGLVSMVWILLRSQDLSAWKLAMSLQLTLSGVTLLAIGAVGEYLARSYEETKARPLYVVTDLVNLAPPATPAPARIERAAILPAAGREGKIHAVGR